MLTLLGFLVASGAGVLERSVGISPLMAGMRAFAGLAMLGAMVAAIVLAIVGLVEYSKPPGVSSRAGLGDLGISVDRVNRAGGRRRFRVGCDAGCQTPEIAGQGRPGQVLTFDDLNFRFRTPGLPWVAFDSAKLNRASKLGFMRRFPDAYFIVIPERIGTGSDFFAAPTGRNRRDPCASRSPVQPCPQRDAVGHQRDRGPGDRDRSPARPNTRFITCTGTSPPTATPTSSLAGGAPRTGSSLPASCGRCYLLFELIDPGRIASDAGGTFQTDFVSRHETTPSASPIRPGTLTSRWKNNSRKRNLARRGDSCFAVVPVFWAPKSPIPRRCQLRCWPY